MNPAVEALFLELLDRHKVRPALAPDGRVLLRGPGPPPAEAIARLRELAVEARAFLDQVAARLPAFLAQARTPGPWPLLVLPGTDARPGTCVSCASPLPADAWCRCAPCRFAVRLALEAPEDAP